MEIRIKIPFPEDPRRRALLITVVSSLLLHVLLLGALIWSRPFSGAHVAKRGEPLLVDIAPERPEEKAPRGDPSKPVTPAPEPPPARAEAPRPPQVKPAPPAPRVQPPKPAAEPPRQIARPAPEPPRAPEPPKPAPEPPREAAPPPAPEPPKEVARATPPEPPKPAPEPAPRAQEPEPRTPPLSARGTGEPFRLPAPGPPPPPAPPGQTAALPRAGTPPGMWRGGGLDRGRGGVEGDPIPLDTPEPRYQDYFNKIRQRIKSHWTYPREAGDRGIQGDLQIEFIIAKDGRLQFIELRRSSGVEILDTAAMNAVRLAQPFPPVPDDIAKQALAINGLFRYQIVGASLLNHYIR